MFQLWQSKNVANGIMLYLSYLILKLVCKGWLGFKLPLEFLIVFLVLSFQFLGLFLKPIDLNNRVILQCSQLYILSILRFRRGKKTSPYLIFKLTEFCCLFHYLFLKHFILKTHKWNVSRTNKIPILCVYKSSKSLRTSFLYSSWAMSLISKFFLTLHS